QGSKRRGPSMRPAKWSSVSYLPPRRKMMSIRFALGHLLTHSRKKSSDFLCCDAHGKIKPLIL
ncbi:hypothetical protein, partial [Agrobacterium sp.]|uniref:hypothetical protein n=1 Tax=Agrobacterium sp. TaxID=361 RepID=UPI004033A4E3